MPSEPPDKDKSHPEETPPTPAGQSVSASEGSTVQGVTQISIPGKLEGDIVLGDKNRSDAEELNDYLDWAVTDFENRMADFVLDPQQPDGPFKSLEHFKVEDASIFFGRGTAIHELHERVVSNRLMILYARSGAGKSSILNAGLSPLLLREARLPVYVRVQPFQEDLVREIKQAIFPPSRKPWPKLLDSLTLLEFLGVVGMKRRRTKELVILLDQFEQFLISLPNKEIHQSFIEILRDCYDDRILPVRFVIALKHENLGDLDPFEQYIPGILQNRYRLLPMSEAEVREAITGPIAKVRPEISFEPALLDELVRELAKKDVELTHLQIVCSQLYDALPEGQKVITTGLYEKLGKVENILATYLDRTLEPLPEYKHEVAQKILEELVSSESTNLILRLPDFEQAVEPDPAVIEEVLQYLVNNRLLRRGTDQAEDVYELAHAYLAEKISMMIGKDKLEKKRAQDLLKRELVNSRMFQTKIEPEKLNYLRAHLQSRQLEDNARELLFASSLAYGHDVDFWIDQMPDRHAAARTAASAALGNTQIANSLKSGLARDLQAEVLPVLWEAYKRQDRRQRQQAIDTLSILEDWLAPHEKSDIRWALRRVKARQVVQGIRPLRVTAVFGFSLLFWFIFFIEHPAPGNWITIPEGSFTMGMDRAEAEKAYQECLNGTDQVICNFDFEVNSLLNENSGRLEDAWLPAYAILENEVTTAQYRLCIEADACRDMEPVDRETPRPGANTPVRDVSWTQASAYCAWLGGRLPTEAEWEKAARGPGNSFYPWGADWVEDLANLDPLREGDRDVMSVLEYADTDVSGYGVLNLAGNVREWTASRFLDRNPDQPFNNDVLTMDVVESKPEVLVVLRGGSWQTVRSEGLAPRRNRSMSNVTDPTTGFRCVCLQEECTRPGELWWTLFHRR